MEERKLKNYDDPSSISKYDFLNALSQLRDGKSVKIFQYSFKNHVRTENYRIVNSSDLLIIEGIFSFSFNEILNLYDLKIYVDLDTDLRLIRRILRDSRERGRSLQTTINQYLDTIRPTQERFVKKDKNLADIIIFGDREHTKILNLIVSYIENNK